MWWGGDTFMEMIGSGVVLVAFLVVVSPAHVEAATEFTVYRLQQYQLHGYSYGGVGSVVGVEAGSLNTKGPLVRQCVVARLAEVTPEVYQRVAESGAVALLVILPYNMTAMAPEAKQLAREVEQAMLSQETSLAVYFAQDSSSLTAIHMAVHSRSSAATASAAASFFSSLASDGYQMVVTAPQSKPMHDVTIANIQGKLSGYGAEEKLPTLGLVAHYDAFGAAPELAYGGDSNASGVAALLEVARIFSRLYRSQHTHPATNLFLMMTGGGTLNYQGSRKWLDEVAEGSDGLLGEGQSQLILCLDSLAATDALYLHVSKPPKVGTLQHRFYETLVAAGADAGVAVSLVHRKINLQNDRQPWEHQKYSLRRLPAATLSALPSPDTLHRGSILDTVESLNTTRLLLHTQVLTTAILRHIYTTHHHNNNGNINNNNGNDSDKDIDNDNDSDNDNDNYNNNSSSISEGLSQRHPLKQLPKTLAVSRSALLSWLELLCSSPRSPQLLQPTTHPLIIALQQALARYTGDTKVSSWAADKADPEYGFHDITTATMTAYTIKPASFDLLLSLAITAYLGAIFLAMQQLPRLQALLLRVSGCSNSKLKSY